MNVFKEIKTTLIGLLMMAYGIYEYNITTEEISLVSFESYYIGCFMFIGFVLLFTGDKYINELIEMVINKFRK